MNFKQYMLYMLQQCGYIFSKHSYKQLVVGDDEHLSSETVMMKVFQAV